MVPLKRKVGAYYQVNIPMEPFEPTTLELLEDEMEPVSDGETPKPIEKEKIAEYLLNGGLVSILRSNLLGGQNQPRAWLCLDNLRTSRTRSFQNVVLSVGRLFHLGR